MEADQLHPNERGLLRLGSRPPFSVGRLQQQAIFPPTGTPGNHARRVARVAYSRGEGDFVPIKG